MSRKQSISLLPKTGRHGRRGLTLIEVMVAMAIALIVIAGATSVLIQISRDNRLMQARLDAVTNARAALRDMTFEIKKANFTPAGLNLRGINQMQSQGDRVDNDGDGRIDEDRPDGRIGSGADGITPEDALFTDLHARIGAITERGAFVGVADIDDAGVDDDAVFNSDRLSFSLFPASGISSTTVTYAIQTFEGEPHVLMRQIETDNGTTVTRALEPLAFNVLSLNLLYWDANASPAYWVEEWDSAALAGPNIRLPASVYMEIVCYAGTRPLVQIGPAEPLEVVRLHTIANIEAVIISPDYFARRPVTPP